MGQWNTRSYLGKMQRSHDLPKPPKYRKTREKYRNTCERHLLKLASVAQLDAPSDWRPGGRRFNPRRGRQHSFVEIDHEIFSTVILSLPLIQEGQLSVSGERMCTILVNSFPTRTAVMSHYHSSAASRLLMLVYR